MELADCRDVVSAEQPSGPNLEYDSRFQDLMRYAEGTREQQYGSTVIAAKPPEWKAMRPLIRDLITETRDLRLGVLMVEVVTHFEGLPGLARALDVIRAWVATHWDSLHPELDPEDELDPFVRINALARLNEDGRLPSQIQRLPLAESPPHLRVTLADCEAARQSSGDPELGVQRLTLAEIEATFAGAELEQLRQNYEACQGACHTLNEISRILRERAVEGGWEPNVLKQRLRDCGELLKQHLRSRMNAADSALEQVSMTAAGRNDAQRTSGWQDGWSTSESGEAGLGANARISSREEAGEVLQRVVEYFETHEPSSPVPLLLRRAKRLINQDFVEILRDVAPDGLMQVQSLAGEFDDS